MYYLKNYIIISLLSISLVLVSPNSDGNFINTAHALKKTNIEVSDPLEEVNRAVYGFNSVLDKILFKPIAKTYRLIVPKLGRKGIRNVLRNLTEPVTFVNSILQGDVEHTFTTFWRFSLNTTLGIGGLFDIAEKANLHHRPEDFGQTAGVYGVGHGPYIMLPILGPSNTRDAFGSVVDIFTDPFNYLHDDIVISRTLVKGLDAREKTLDLTDELDRVSLDPYASLRSLYTQKREDNIANGK